MTRMLPSAAFMVGLLLVGWIGAGYLPDNPLALVLVGLIGAFFLVGGLELRRYHEATVQMTAHLVATAVPPSELAPWLAAVPASLRSAVRLRLAGERVPLPAPALTPYLAGLLVLLGMLGTFLGMVVTLKGTGLALDSATNVDTIRASLAAPIKGLGVAFGTSVAGVAASAVLGLLAALARRERQRLGQALDVALATTLQLHTRSHAETTRQDEMLRLLAVQAQALPALVAQIQGLVGQMERQGPALAAQVDRQGQALHVALQAGQERFHAEARTQHAALAESVGRALTASLAEGARQAGAAISPAVQATLEGLGLQATAVQVQLAATAQHQLEAMAAQLQAATTALLDGAAQRQAHALEQARAALSGTAARFEAQAATLLHGVAQAHARHESAAAEREQARALSLQAELAGMAANLREQGQQATQAMAGVVVEMRHLLADSAARENATLDERSRLLQTLAGLLEAVGRAAGEQRAAIDALLQATTDVLGRAGTAFTQTVQTGAQSLQDAAAQTTAGAAEVASLGEGFGLAVELFCRTTGQLSEQLQRIEGALGRSLARSDEQMAYYVAQAREIIDLTLGSHKQIVDDLQQLARTAPRAAAPELAPADAA